MEHYRPIRLADIIFIMDDEALVDIWAYMKRCGDEPVCISDDSFELKEGESFSLYVISVEPVQKEDENGEIRLGFYILCSDSIEIVEVHKPEN